MEYFYPAGHPVLFKMAMLFCVWGIKGILTLKKVSVMYTVAVFIRYTFSTRIFYKWWQYLSTKRCSLGLERCHLIGQLTDAPQDEGVNGSLGSIRIVYWSSMVMPQCVQLGPHLVARLLHGGVMLLVACDCPITNLSFLITLGDYGVHQVAAITRK